MNPWNNPIYTDAQMDKLNIASRNYQTSGFPQKSNALIEQMAASVPYKDIQMPDGVKDSIALRPETLIDISLVDIPPRHGLGSGQGVWAEFAELVSDMDPEVIEQFTRDEIIGILVDRDIINEEEDKTSYQRRRREGDATN